jgi:transposase-like protein
MPARRCTDRCASPGFTITEAARLIGVAPETVWRWCQLVPHFGRQPDNRAVWTLDPVSVGIIAALRSGKPRLRTDVIKRLTSDPDTRTRVFYELLVTRRVRPKVRDAINERLLKQWRRLQELTTAATKVSLLTPYPEDDVGRVVPEARRLSLLDPTG